MEWIGDIGGLLDGLCIAGSFFVSPFAAIALNQTLNYNLIWWLKGHSHKDHKYKIRKNDLRSRQKTIVSMPSLRASKYSRKMRQSIEIGESARSIV